MKKFVAACIVSLMLAGCVSPEAEPHDFHGEDFEERIYVEDFSLMSSNNTTWNFTEQTYGKVSIAVFPVHKLPRYLPYSFSKCSLDSGKCKPLRYA